MEGLKDEEKDNSTVYGSTYDFLCTAECEDG